MDATQFAYADPGLAKTLTQLLEGLGNNPENGELHTLLKSGLARFQRRGPINGEYVLWLHEQLSIYAKDPVALPRARIKARLIQQHLSLHLPQQEAPVTARDVEPVPAAEAAEPAQPTAPLPDHTQERKIRYEALRRSEQDAWRAIYTNFKDFNHLKHLWASSLDELTRERDTLAAQLNAAHEQLGAAQNETRELREQLSRARELPTIRAPRRLARLSAAKLPRRGAALAGRDVFLRQLDAEAERVRRHGAPLAVALLGIHDELLVDEQRQTAGITESAMRHYASEILQSFRTYDVAVHIDNSEFAVLFPSTTREGAQRAIEKAQKRAAESHFMHDGASYPLPGFAAVLALYAPGETPVAMLERARERLQAARTDVAHPLVVL